MPPKTAFSQQDVLARLEAGLMKVGLEPKMLAIMNDKLSLRLRGDPLELTSQCRHLAHKAARTMDDRDILEFVQGLVEELRIVIEQEAEAAKGRPKPGNRPADVWDQFPEELRPQADLGGAGDSNTVITNNN
jgi:hypothetical protein